MRVRRAGMSTSHGNWRGYEASRRSMIRIIGLASIRPLIDMGIIYVGSTLILVPENALKCLKTYIWAALLILIRNSLIAFFNYRLIFRVIALCPLPAPMPDASPYSEWGYQSLHAEVARKLPYTPWRIAHLLNPAYMDQLRTHAIFRGGGLCGPVDDQ